MPYPPATQLLKSKKAVKEKNFNRLSIKQVNENFNVSGTYHPLDVKQFLHDVSSLLIA